MPNDMPEDVQNARDSMRRYFDDTVHPNESYSVYCQLVDDLEALELHITTQARRIAELEAMLKDSNELLTIAHMDGYHKGRASALSALEKLAAFARHTDSCAAYTEEGEFPCCCGYEAARAAAGV